MDEATPTDIEPAHVHEHGPDVGAQDLLDPAATELQARHGCTCAWWQLTTFVEVAGPDAATFLDAIATQDMAGIAPGTARHALFLTNKARIIVPTIAYRVDEGRFLLELDPRRADELVAHLTRYRLRAKAVIAAVDAGAVSLVGPGAPDAAAELTPAPGAAWFESPAWGVPARTLVGAREDAHALVALIEQRGEPGLADPESLDAVRIETQVPALNDLLVGSMPAEVGAMDLAVALDKGCYLGQEPVARLHYRGHANRSLRLVELDADLPDDYFDDVPEESDDYLAIEREDGDGRAVGVLTSWAHRASGDIVGLAVLRREAEAGDRLRMRGTGVTLTAR